MSGLPWYYCNSILKKQAIPRSRQQRHELRRAAFGSAPEVAVTASQSYRALAIRYVSAILLVIPGSLSPANHLHWYLPSRCRVQAHCESFERSEKLDWLRNAEWTYAGIFAVAAWFQYQDRFWVPPQKPQGSFY